MFGPKYIEDFMIPKDLKAPLSSPETKDPVQLSFLPDLCPASLQLSTKTSRLLGRLHQPG